MQSSTKHRHVGHRPAFDFAEPTEELNDRISVATAPSSVLAPVTAPTRHGSVEPAPVTSRSLAHASIAASVPTERP
jgi:hypothetical protein